MPEAGQWLESIPALTPPRRDRVLEIIGGQERTIGPAGLRGVLADNIVVIPGPGSHACHILLAHGRLAEPAHAAR